MQIKRQEVWKLMWEQKANNCNLQTKYQIKTEKEKIGNDVDDQEQRMFLKEIY